MFCNLKYETFLFFVALFSRNKYSNSSTLRIRNTIMQRKFNFSLEQKAYFKLETVIHRYTVGVAIVIEKSSEGKNANANSLQAFGII